MKLKKSLKIALNIIIHSKLRSWLTILGIVIGVASIIAIVSIGNGFEKDIQAQLGGLGSDIISITAGFDRANECPGPNCNRGGASQGSSNLLTNKEVQAIKSIPDVSFVNAIVSDSSDVYYLGSIARLSVDGVDESVWKFMTTSKLENGRLLSPGDTNSVVIGNSIAKEIFKKDINVNGQITIGGKSFRVVGILAESGGFGMDDRKIFMPVRQARELFDKEPNTYDAIVVKVRNQENIDQVEKLIEKKLMVVRHVTEDTKDFTVISMKSIQESVSAILAGFTLFLGVIAAVSLLVGAVGIANTMFTSVLEKTKEIGIMKALGAKNADIMAIFLFNSGLVGLVGGIIGALIGVSIALLIPQLGFSFSGDGTPLSTSISITFILFILIFSIGIGMLSGIMPAYRASKLRPVQALRSE
jgi:putative ABC transport system permease protein